MTAGLVLVAAGLLGLLAPAGPAAAGEKAAAPAAASAPGSVPPRARPPLGHDQTTYTFGVAPFAPTYTPPPPGSYELPPIDTVGDHPVVDADGNRTTLSSLIGDRLAVVSFIYASCSEAAGCPMSTAVLHHLDRHLSEGPGLAKDVALVTVSFDPGRDTPERLAAMQKQRAPGSGWRFVTSPDEAALQPLLDDFGQTIAKLLWPDGTWTGVYRHVLKVFLLDRERRVRNVYSVGLLHPELVKNDLETLRMEGGR